MTHAPELFCDNPSCSCRRIVTTHAEEEFFRKFTGVDNDPVNHPPHYNNHPSGIECIQITRWMNFNLGNTFKYIWRTGQKTPDLIQDLEKAQWYLADEIKRLKALK